MPIPKMTFEDQRLQDFLATKEPTTDAAALAQSPDTPVTPQPSTTDVPAAVGVSRETYDDAWVENSHREFAMKLALARAPTVKPYVAPTVAPRIAETTRLEMEAGARRVAQFAEAEQHRRVIPRKKEPWEGNTTSIFRPLDYVPDPRSVPGNGARVVTVA